MATSAHLGIRDAVKALLAGLAVDCIFGNRDLAMASDVRAQINVTRVQSEPTQETTSHPIDWVTSVRIEIRARSADGASAEAIADDLACQCFARVMADQELGGLAQYIEPGAMEWDDDQAESGVEKVTWTFNVTHVTENNVIT